MLDPIHSSLSSRGRVTLGGPLQLTRNISLASLGSLMMRFNGGALCKVAKLLHNVTSPGV